MRIGFILLAILTFCVGCSSKHARSKDYHDVMKTLARDFIKRNGLQHQSFSTNDVTHHKFDLFDDGRVGGIGSLHIKTYSFTIFVENEKSEINDYMDLSVKTYYDLSHAPKEKIEAVKALLLRNKLNEKEALELATKYFKLQGHVEENFHAVKFHQLGWTGPSDSAEKEWYSTDKPTTRGGLLPYYQATWYRKDADLNDHGALHPIVQIEVSGITSLLIRYSKWSMPIGSDF